MKYGYIGKILRVDLSNNSVKVEEKGDLFYRKYMGGACLGAYYLLKELPPKIDPLSSDNLIIFSTSPTTGVLCPGVSMHAITSKSPLTNLIGENITPGGYFGAEIKKAGYDAIIIKGKAKNPSYLFINNDEVEIRNASKIWGNPTSESYDLLINELEEKGVRIALIGLAGENMVRYASIVTDNMFFSTRGGIGAVMGSKNLKAVCITGTKEISIYDKEKIKTLSDDFKDNFLSNPLCKLQNESAGNAGYLKLLSDHGWLSAKNFNNSYFEGADNIDGNTIIKKYRSVNINCYGCYNGCKKILKGINKINLDSRFGNIELESLASCVYNLLIDDIDSALTIWNSICENGIDGTSLGATIAFAIECFQNGLISKKDTNGIDLNWGDADSVLKIIDMIAKREGIGDILANGTRYASTKIKDSEKYAMHVKGMEIPVHEPRAKQMVGLGYAVSPIGPYYSIVEHDNDFDFNADQLFMDKVSPLGIYERLPAESLSEKKVRLFYLLQPAGFSMLDALCCCIFAFSPVRYFNFHQLVEIVNSVTGWESSLFELWKLGEKRINMYKLFAKREGIDKKDDILPERFFEPIKNGPKRGLKINKDEFIKARDLYYQLSGWDKNGIPTYSKLLELDLLEFV